MNDLRIRPLPAMLAAILIGLPIAPAATAADRMSTYDRMTADAAGGDAQAREMLRHLATACPAVLGEFPKDTTAFAVMHEKGICVKPDPAKAFDGYRKAAQEGGPAELEMLGRAYARGIGVARNDAEALGWFRKAMEARIAQNAQAPIRFAGGEPGARKAAEDGNPFAMAQLAWMSLARQDDAQAARWLRALESSDVRPAAALALMYQEGRGGFAIDKPKALALYEEAAEGSVAIAVDGLVQVLYALASRSAPEPQPAR